MIKAIDIIRKTLHFHAPFEIAYEKVEEADVIIIKLKTDDGFVGLGNAAPDTEVTGETVEGVSNVLREKLIPDFFSDPFESWYRYHEKIMREFDGYPSAQAAVEEAILNIWSQKSGMPLSAFFGGYRKSCPIMITIGIKDKKETLDEAKKRLKEGFKIIKLKGGLDVEGDIARIKAVKRITPAGCSLILDANQGYSTKDAKKLIKDLKKGDLELIEQPTKAEDIDVLKELHKISPIPIFADESVVSMADAIRLIKDDCVSGVNIKLMKCGGPINFINIFNLAKAFGKSVVLGCMYETNISMTTGAHLALGLPVDYVDLDSGPLDFYDDPIKGGAKVDNGMIKIEGALEYSPN
jgi:o-succinylbenzoate synthase